MSTTDSGQPVRPARQIDTSLVSLDSVRTVADFAECLDQLRVLAGPLSHREIASRSGGLLRRTKIGQVLGGELPRREFLTTYLEVCGVSHEAGDAWLRLWARLVSTTRSPSHLPEDDPQVLRKERDAARTQVQRLTNELETLRSATHAADAEREATIRRARQASEMNESAVRRLRSAQTAREEAQGHVRLLSQEVMAGRARITELNDTADKLRAELESAAAEIAGLRRELVGNRSAPNDSKRLIKYTQSEAEELYGTDEMTSTQALTKFRKR